MNYVKLMILQALQQDENAIIFDARGYKDDRRSWYTTIIYSNGVVQQHWYLVD